MHQLTNSERAIRRSRGIPAWRILPFLMPFIALLIVSMDGQFLQECFGRQIQGSNRFAGWARFIVAMLCSPRYVRDFSNHWLVIAIFFAGIALAIPQLFWIRRHKAYWDIVREKEKLKRAEKATKANRDHD